MVFSILTRLCNHHHYLLPDLFITPKRNPDPISHHSSSSPPPGPWQPGNCFLSLWIGLFCTFHRNGIIQYRALCVWLFSLSIKVFKVHPHCRQVSICTPLLFWLANIPFYGFYHILFIHITVIGHLGYFHFGAIMNMTMNIHILIEVLNRYMISIL